MPTPKSGRPVDLAVAARIVADQAARAAPLLDHDGAFPSAAIETMRQAGLLAAPVPVGEGGVGLGAEPDAALLADVLRIVGRGHLPLGRLYEGHVNALQLIGRYGDAGQRRRLFDDAREGHLFGVWNTGPAGDDVTIARAPGGLRLHGRKILASGAGFVTRPLITVRWGDAADGPPLILVPLVEPGARADLSGWRAHGMRASATGALDFTDLLVPEDALIGAPDDYHAQPFFSGGAWRFAAVQLGGIEAVFEAWRTHLVATRRGSDPHQAARLGHGAMAVETARLWVRRAAAIATDRAGEPDAIVAFVNLARLAVERAGLDVLDLAGRSVGLQGFMRDHPMERIARDLATYLRQPAPDRALTGAAGYVLESAAPIGDLWPVPDVVPRVAPA